MDRRAFNTSEDDTALCSGGGEGIGNRATQEEIHQATHNVNSALFNFAKLFSCQEKLLVLFPKTNATEVTADVRKALNSLQPSAKEKKNT